MNLTDKAKETARYLVEQWDMKDIQSFTLFKTFGGWQITSKEKRDFTDFKIPELSLLEELKIADLISMDRNHKGNYEILLLQSLRDVVQSNSRKDKTSDIPIVKITEEHEKIVGNLINQLATINQNDEQLASKQQLALRIARQIFGNDSDFYNKLLNSNIEFQELKTIVEEIHITIKLSLSKVEENTTMDSETIQRQFLETIARAYPRYLMNQGKGRKHYIKISYSPDGKEIADIDGFHHEFYRANRQFLTIPAVEFFKMTSQYFSKARGDGNYYVNIMAIKEALDGENSSRPSIACDVFVIMPFRESLTGIYDHVIVPLCKQLNLEVRRGDDRQKPDANIMDEVFAYMHGAEIIIVDCTEVDGQVNGNVYYELGYADALPDKYIILISQTTPEKLPFDIRHRGIIVYQDTTAGSINLNARLQEAIQQALSEG